MIENINIYQKLVADIEAIIRCLEVEVKEYTHGKNSSKAKRGDLSDCGKPKRVKGNSYR